MSRHPRWNATVRHWILLGVGGLLVTAAGCATFWDEALSHERDWAYITGVGKPHPIDVIRKNPDGGVNADHHRRAQAFSELREPLHHGGNVQDQEAYLNILSAAARTDSNPQCRLTAIRALGRFKDPRAARILEEVYQQPKMPFTIENNALIRKEALAGLEQSHNDEARHLLIRVARGPGPATTADLIDRQQTQDEKIVAIRALRHYKNHPECVETLRHVLKTEKDVALRSRAVESLEQSTGQRWPIEYAAWQRPNVQPLPNNDGFIQTVTGLLPK